MISRRARQVRIRLAAARDDDAGQLSAICLRIRNEGRALSIAVFRVGPRRRALYGTIVNIKRRVTNERVGRAT